jgi:predicted ATPase
MPILGAAKLQKLSHILKFISNFFRFYALKAVILQENSYNDSSETHALELSEHPRGHS